MADDNSFFVPEKFDWGPDRQQNVWYDIKERERFTIDNLIENYAEVIGKYLLQNDYEAVILAGASEGGYIVPELYFRLKDFNVSGIVSIAAGGLSLDEAYETLYEQRKRLEGPFALENLVHNLIDTRSYNYGVVLSAFGPIHHNNLLARNSTEPVWPEGTRDNSTYRWYNSFLFREPIEFYREIEIPVLFMHGEYDINVPVESTRYIEENLPGKPFTYRYYPEMWHSVRKYGEFMAMRQDIFAWIEAEGL